jgi:hypothetical protein
MKQLLFILLILPVLTASCSKQKRNNRKFTPEQVASLELDSTQLLTVNTDSIVTIDLNPFLKISTLDLCAVIESVSYIPLETTDESLVSEVECILVTDTHIYIRDTYMGGSVLIFSREGKFINHIKRGQGPAEILNLKDIAFDKENQELVVYHYKMLSFYTPDGEYKRRERIPFNAFSFSITPDGYLFRAVNGVDNSHMGYSETFQVLMTDKTFKLISVGIPYIYSKDLSYGIRDYTHAAGENINFTVDFNDTVYQYVNNKKVKAKYCLDFSSKRFPENLLKEFSTDDFFRLSKEKNYYYFEGTYVENSSHEYFQLSNRHTRIETLIFRDKKSGNVLAGTTLSYFQIAPVIELPIASKDSLFIGCFQPHDIDTFKSLLADSKMVSAGDRIKLKQLREDDNPVLVIFKLKNF